MSLLELLVGAIHGAEQEVRTVVAAEKVAVSVSNYVTASLGVEVFGDLRARIYRCAGESDKHKCATKVFVFKEIDDCDGAEFDGGKIGDV